VFAVVDRLLCVEATASSVVPRRITGLLAQRRMPVSSMHMSRRPEDGSWYIQLVVDLADASEVDLLVKRLNRVVDVVRVLVPDVGPSHQRQSLFVKLEPQRSALGSVAEIARLFAAEVLDLDLDPARMTLHICASPRRCDQFLALLEPYSVVEIVPGSICVTCPQHASTRRSQPRRDGAATRVTDTPVQLVRVDA
jgi:acetolactate synthase I/III small subunit